MEARFRFKNLHYCGKPWDDIVGKCLPRCVRIKKTDKQDNQVSESSVVITKCQIIECLQVFLSFDCEYSMIQDGFTGEIVNSSGDTYLLR